jgi:hypothetical protein
MDETKSNFVIDKKEIIGDHDDDKPPPNLCALSVCGSVRMVSRLISYAVHNQATETLSSIDSLYRKSGGTFGIQEFY